MKKKIEWLKRFSETCGVSGFESRIKTLLLERLDGQATVSYDKLGSVVFTAKGKAETPKVMLASHMDEIGFMVKHITKEGFLRFICLGGWWEQVMLGQRVIVHGKNGDLVGVIGSKPPHILTAEERSKVVQKKDMYIDIGAKDDEEARTLGVFEGCPVTPYANFAAMGDGKTLLGKAWDNRIGCAVMADVMEEIATKKHPNTVYGVATVQEEVGLRGAQTSVNLLKPDIAFVIDTCVAGGTPGVADEIAPAKIGEGIAITIYDAGMIPNTALRDYAFATAKALDIPTQISVSEGGSTDGGRIHLHDAGVLTLTFSIPTRYIHSHQSIIHIDDYLNAVKLIVAMLEKLDSKKYEELLMV
ncbi:MAG TPA: M42 family metallopeptidase [Candidatus Avacidaminococcus intestinavium]|uniref:M42 family metallopeptidase n=1 Tax=Candidatus Avacidaminococcus intestinavium TaxID=2840684 RepID=A0A9D1MR79_9FIRM|nr:M42 family metallopeptidase [Candidatus Avacidaminococcus intestinavium]